MDFKTLVAQITTLFTNLNKKQKITIAASTLGAIALIVFLVLYTSSKSEDSGYGVLFNKLSPSDSALVIQQLESDNIPYKLINEGTIKVPKEEIYKERIKVASQGIPKDSKVGFELFDKQNFGETDFAQNIKFLRALEGELARTIKSLNPIEDATVKIALPKESVFVEEKEEPTASVVLRLKKDRKLSQDQAVGIKNLVSASVAKLKPQNVKLINQDGNPIDEANSDGFSKQEIVAQMDYKRAYEKSLEDKIVKILRPIVGSKEKISAKVTADFDFNQKRIHDEYFDPDSVVRSEQSVEIKREGSKSDDSASGVPGAISNIAPTKDIGKNGSNKEKYTKNSTTTNYEISKKITDTKGEYAKLLRLTSAVVVDGKYEKDKEGKTKYIPLQKSELSAIEDIVKRTIGYNKKRGDEVTVSNLEFKAYSNKKPPTQIEKTTNMIAPFLPLIKYLIAAILLFIFYKKFISPFAQKMLEDFQTPQEEEEKDDELEEEDDKHETLDKYNKLKKKIEQELGLDEDMDEETLKHNIVVEKMRENVNEHPEELAKLIEALMRNE